ncbi:MAG TPA: RNA methyltransferase [Phycisphaerales bacterium]|nr:RNA methyltransferase [Phycisphaerales bacterium]HMP38707.1 RNA methyltransferase [Phycisphaerales bacterium]
MSDSAGAERDPATEIARAIEIDSLDDPRVAGYRDVRDRELRGRDGLFVVESLRCVERLLASRFEIESLLVAPRRLAALAQRIVLSRAGRNLGSSLERGGRRVPRFEGPVYVAEETLLSSIAGYRIHGGALALARRPRRTALSFEPWAAALGLFGAVDAEAAAEAGSAGTAEAAHATEATESRGDASVRSPSAPRTLIALAGVTQMDNVGSIFRSAAGLGVEGILLDERCCDPLLRKPIRVAMGHSLTLPFAWSRDLPSDLARLRAGSLAPRESCDGVGAGVGERRSERGWRVVALEEGANAGAIPGVSPGAIPGAIPGASRVAVTHLSALAPDERMVLVAGNEGHGLDRAVIDVCDDIVEIPMAEGVPSLNVAVAVAIGCWERRRLRALRSPSGRAGER